MDQARSEEEEKERKRDRKDKGQEADGKKGRPTKTHRRDEEKQYSLIADMLYFINSFFFLFFQIHMAIVLCDQNKKS